MKVVVERRLLLLQFRALYTVEGEKGEAIDLTVKAIGGRTQNGDEASALADTGHHGRNGKMLKVMLLRELLMKREKMMELVLLQLGPLTEENRIN